jgi:hypothetical protein
LSRAAARAYFLLKNNKKVTISSQKILKTYYFCLALAGQGRARAFLAPLADAHGHRLSIKAVSNALRPS